MKIFSTFLVTAILFSFLSSCKKDSNDNSPAPIIVKYEVKVSDAIKDTSANNGVSLQYVNGNGQTVTVSEFAPGATSWTKIDTIKTSTRPLTLTLSQSSDVFLVGAGSITGSISINGGIRAYSYDYTSNSFGIYRVGITPLSVTLD